MAPRATTTKRFGGHFAVATGQSARSGEWSDWIVNNFYNLDSVSEKGIIAAPVPMDNYLMDLNSGQQYYRPSYMLVAVLSNARTAARLPGRRAARLQPFLPARFHLPPRQPPTAPASAWTCSRRWAGTSRSAGRPVDLKALGAYAYLAAKDGSLASGRKIYDYLTEEQTRLYPAVAFDAAGHDLLQLVGASTAPRASCPPYEQQLQDDVEAMVLVRIPQVPSSRAMGSAPVFSFDEFMARMPADQDRLEDRAGRRRDRSRPPCAIRRHGAPKPRPRWCPCRWPPSAWPACSAAAPCGGAVAAGPIKTKSACRG